MLSENVRQNILKLNLVGFAATAADAGAKASLAKSGMGKAGMAKPKDSRDSSI